MNRIIGIIMCWSLAISVNAVTCQKEWKKLAKQMAKELTKEGWVVCGSSLSVEKALEIHFQALMERGQEVTVVKGRGMAKAENQAFSKARLNASVQYAQLKGTHVESIGKMDVITETDGGTSTNSYFDMTSNLKAEHRMGKMMPTVSLMRILSDGSYEALLYYVIEKEEQPQ